MRFNIRVLFILCCLLLDLGGCGRRAADPGASIGAPGIGRSARPAPAGSLRVTQRSIEADELGLTTARTDLNGQPVRVACRTCHVGLVHPGPDAYRRAKAIFHKEIRLDHGTKTCRTCHRAPQFDDFNLADGTRVPAPQVMRLCGQCHARRLREYQHGAHGGMRGYWDRSRGPRQRNHCLDCHDAHHPAIDRVQPAPRARNR